ncbi:alanine racemase [Agrobacterium rhizogenes]|nr:alanine racemase [Rhizobium rhizogenes]
METVVLPAVLTIDLGALKRNFQRLATMVFPASLGAVLKANAYGLGLTHIVPTLFSAGCRWFFVAHLAEARQIQQYLPADVDIVVLNGLLPEERIDDVCSTITPVINSCDQYRRWLNTPYHGIASRKLFLQVDTGMSRLGMTVSEVSSILRNVPAKCIDSLILLSHFASADDPGNESNAHQLQQLRQCSEIISCKVSVANSGAVFLGPNYHGDLVRAGISIFGGSPTIGHRNALEPVVRLDARIIQIRSIESGTAVGYGGTYIAKGMETLATVSAGYADGLPRSLSNQGSVFYRGVRLPIVGRISMDSMVVKISALPWKVRYGDTVEILGPNQTIDKLASDADTISYEILTKLGSRLHRLYGA